MSDTQSDPSGTLRVRWKCEHACHGSRRTQSVWGLLQNQWVTVAHKTPRGQGCARRSRTKFEQYFPGETAASPSPPPQSSSVGLDRYHQWKFLASRVNSSHPGNITALRKHRLFTRVWALLKASGLSCSGLIPKRIDWWVWAHAGHWAVIIFVSLYKSSLKLKSLPRLALFKLKASAETSTDPDTRMQSLSLRMAT